MQIENIFLINFLDSKLTRIEKNITSLKSCEFKLSFSLFSATKIVKLSPTRRLNHSYFQKFYYICSSRKNHHFFIGGQYYWCSSENFLTSEEIPCGFVLLPFYLMLSGILSNYARVIQFLELPPQAKTANDSHSTAQRWILIRFKQNKNKNGKKQEDGEL